MIISKFVLQLKRQGLELSVDGSELIIRGNKKVLSAEVIDNIKIHKAEIIQFLSEINLDNKVYEPIPKVPTDKPLPVSLVQQSYWFLDQLEEGNSATYNMPVVLSLQGRVSVDALKFAFDEIIKRHDSLRTCFINDDGVPKQSIQNSFEFNLSTKTLENASDVEIKQHIRSVIRTPFNLEKDLLIKAELLAVASEEYVLIINMHHIIADGWSLGIFVKEFTALYSAYKKNLPSPLPSLDIQYPDFSVWQREYLAKGEYERQTKFWQDELKDLPPLLDLPTDKPRPPVQSYRGAAENFSWPKELLDKLNDFSRKHNVTLFVTLLTSLNILLSRYSNSYDIAVGTAIANRSRPELENIIGFFVNTIVLRTQFNNSFTVNELLKATHNSTLAAYANPDIPFDVVVDTVQPERSLSVPPLFQVMLRLHNQPVSQVSIDELTITSISADTDTAKLDINISFAESEEGLVGNIEYATDLFNRETIERFINHYFILLNALVEEPTQRIAELPLLHLTEKQQLLVNCNATDMQYPSTECMHELFEVQAAQSPDKLAYVCGDERLTYKTLNDRANQLAHYLRSQGVGPEVRVGLSVGRNSWMAIGMLAIFKAGGTYVPLDPNYPQDRLAHMLDDTRPLLLLTQTNLVEKLPEHQSKVLCLDTIDNETVDYPFDNLKGLDHAEHSAYILYTSGSTGKPKGILVAHKSFRNMANAHKHMHVYDENSRVLQFASLSFSISLWGSFMGWLCGGCVYQVTDESSLPGDALLTLLQTEKINTVTWPVSLLSILPSDGLPELKTVISSAEPCNEEVILRWGVDRRFMNMYGNSEVSLGSTVYDHQVGRQMSIGQPLPNTQMYILNESLEPCPIGVKGEICTAGVGLARGYINRAAATAEKFIPNPFSTEMGSRLYRTGDLGYYLADGSIVFVGREDFQVSVRGFRIELKEIEIVLREHPAVKEVAVVTKADHQGQDRLVAYLVIEAGQSLNYSELRHLLSDRLPSYMLPSIFVTLDEMPLTPNRKVDRLNLPEPDIEAEISREYVAPSTETEKALAGIWQAILDIDKIGVNNHFFEIGGHSLLAVQVISRIEQQFGLKLSVKTAFERPTIKQLAEYIDFEKQREQLTATQDIVGDAEYEIADF